MRRLALASTLLLSFAAFADDVVLKDGRTIHTSRPYTVKGKQAILLQTDGTLISLPLGEIDMEKTSAAKAKAAAPAAAPAPKKGPLTPSEAARVKNPRKASVVLNDEDVSHALGASGGEAAEEGEGRVEVGSVESQKTKTGYSVTGSVANIGKDDATGITLTIQAIGEGNKTIATVYANIAKDTLTAGEKSSFTAEVPTDAVVSNFRYQPRWQVRKTVRPAGDSAAPRPTPGPGENAPAAEPAAAEKKPEAKPAPQNRTDYAAPAPSAPVGAPSTPGGTYLPQPSPEGQPKPPSAP